MLFSRCTSAKRVFLDARKMLKQNGIYSYYRSTGATRGTTLPHICLCYYRYGIGLHLCLLSIMPSSDEITVVLRPLKIISFVCGCIATILYIVCVASEHWLEASGFRQGLWKYCHKPDPTIDTWNCENVDKAWIKATAALIIISLLAAIAGTAMAGVGLMLKDIQTRFTIFMGSVIAHAFTVVVTLVALIVFTSMFMVEIDDYRKTFIFEKWAFSWSYGVAWGSGIFAFGAALLMFADRRNDDIINKTFYNQ